MNENENLIDMEYLCNFFGLPEDEVEELLVENDMEYLLDD